VDVNPPSLTITTPSIGYAVKWSSPDVTWIGSDELAGVDHYEIKSDQGSWISTSLNTSYTLRDLSDGNHTVTVKAIDRVGLSKEETINFRKYKSRRLPRMD
jgi:hypothetical protein